MSKLEVDAIEPQSGTTLTIGASGDTITVPTGATLTVPSGGLSGQNYPAFFAYRTAGQSISNATVTKVQMNIELFDTDTAYDNSTNYRFTVPSSQAGKYYVGAYARHGNFTAAREILFIYKNGSNIMQAESGNAGAFQTLQASTIAELSVGDYLELYGYQDNGSSQTLIGDGLYQSGFFAYRIGD
jgi:hypothetical protein